MSTKAPERPTAFQPEEPTPDTSNKKKSPWKKLIVGVTALAALGGGGAVAYKAGASGENENKPESPREPVASAPVTPGAEQAQEPTETVEPTPTAETEPAAGPVEFSVERYQDGNSLTRAWMESYEDWMNTNTDKTFNDLDPAKDVEAEIRRINSESDNAYIDAMYTSDWQQRPQLDEVLDTSKDVHYAVVYAAMGTTHTDYNDSPEDKEPYRGEWDVKSAVEVSRTDTKMVVNMTYERSDNSDMNRADEFLDRVFNPPVDGAYQTTWQVENGAWKIVDIHRTNS